MLARLGLLMFSMNQMTLAAIRVTAIQSSSLSQKESQELALLLGAKVGSSLDLSELNKKLKSSEGNRKFGNIRLYLVNRGKQKGVLQIEGTRLQVLGSVDWGDLDSQIIADLSLKSQLVSGERIETDKLKTIAEKIRQALVDKGFSQAEVRFDITDREEKRESDLSLRVKKGEQVRVSRVVVAGGDADLRLVLKKRSRIRDNGVFEKGIADTSVEDMLDFLKDNHFPTAKVSWSLAPDSEEPGSQILKYEVDLGRKFRWMVRGNEVFDTQTIRSFFTSEVLTQSDAVARIKKTIEEKYQNLGYHFVSVEVTLSPVNTEQEVLVSVLIREGEKVFIDSIVFDGLWNPVLGKPEKVFFEKAIGVIRRRVFCESLIDSSTKNFIGYLREQGFVSATVSGPRMFFTEDQKGVQLFYDLQLGNLHQIKKIVILGTDLLSRNEFLDVLPFTEGEQVNRDLFPLAEENIRNRLAQEGYLDVKVRLEEALGEASLGSGKEGVEIRFHIQPGPQYVVGEIKIEGLQKTQEKVVRREMLLAPGVPYNPEKVRQSEENIALLGLFGRVEIVSSHGPEAPLKKNLVVIVSEIKPGFGEVGLGALYEDPLLRARTFLGLGYRNLFGLNQTASLRSEVSLPISRSNVLIPFVEYAAIVNYGAPYLLDLPLLFSVQGGFDSFQVGTSSDGKRSDLQTKASVEERIEKRLSRRLNLLYRLHRLQRARTEVIERQDSGETQTLSDTVDIIGSTGPTLTLDFRNDVFNPSSGSFHSLEVELAHPALLANDDLSFVLGLQRNTFYIPLSKDLTWAFYLGSGWARALLNKPLPEARLANELALGGQGTIRGYAPRLFRAPSGVREMAFYNIRTEVTFPLFGDVSGAVFFDSGQLFPDLKPNSRNDGVGAGIRYKTPVGPIVLDLAHGLSPAAESIVRFTFTVGSI